MESIADCLRGRAPEASIADCAGLLQRLVIDVAHRRNFDIAPAGAVVSRVLVTVDAAHASRAGIQFPTMPALPVAAAALGTVRVAAGSSVAPPPAAPPAPLSKGTTSAARGGGPSLRDARGPAEMGASGNKPRGTTMVPTPSTAAGKAAAQGPRTITPVAVELDIRDPVRTKPTSSLRRRRLGSKHAGKLTAARSCGLCSERGHQQRKCPILEKHGPRVTATQWEKWRQAWEQVCVCVRACVRACVGVCVCGCAGGVCVYSHVCPFAT